MGAHRPFVFHTSNFTLHTSGAPPGWRRSMVTATRTTSRAAACGAAVFADMAGAVLLDAHRAAVAALVAGEALGTGGRDLPLLAGACTYRVRRSRVGCILA